MCGDHIIFTWWWVVMEEGMCGVEVMVTCWWVVVEGRGDVYRSGDIFLVVGGGRGARRCVAVR